MNWKLSHAILPASEGLVTSKINPSVHDAWRSATRPQATAPSTRRRRQHQAPTPAEMANDSPKSSKWSSADPVVIPTTVPTIIAAAAGGNHEAAIRVPLGAASV